MSDEYSQKEETTFRTELFRRMDKQDEILDKVLEQTQKTNGRVTKLETITNDYDETKKKVSVLENYRWWILGFGFSFTILAGSTVYYFITNLENKIYKITSQVLEELAKVEYEKVQNNSEKTSN